MRGVRVTKQMGRDAFLELGTPRRVATRIPYDLRGDRLFRAPGLDRAGKQPRLRPHPLVVHAERLQKAGAERHVAITPALAVLNVNQHASTVDVADLQVAELGV